MTRVIRLWLVGIAVVMGLSLTATPAMAQCNIEMSVYADAAIGDYDSNGNADLFGYASGVDNSSCSGAAHTYSTSVCAERIEDGTPVFCGESESLSAQGSSTVGPGGLVTS